MGAGAVIHSMHEEQNIMKMGGLKKQLPKTYLIFVMGWLAICGIPPFSGFFSKDEILWLSLASEHGSPILWFVGMLTAFLTAFYMTRLVSLVFWGKARFQENKKHPVHDSPWVMIAPLGILAVLSLIAGFIGIPHLSWIAHWLGPITPELTNFTVPGSVEWVLMGVSVLAAVVAMFLAKLAYSGDKASAKAKFPKLQEILLNKWYVDEFYGFLVVRPLKRLGDLLWHRVDERGIDRAIVGVGRISIFSGDKIRLLQTGTIQHYLFALAIGLALTTGWIIYGSF
jgi:NADH-quinone oxidoreductase subunit L